MSPENGLVSKTSKSQQGHGANALHLHDNDFLDISLGHRPVSRVLLKYVYLLLLLLFFLPRFLSLPLCCLPGERVANVLTISTHKIKLDRDSLSC